MVECAWRTPTVMATSPRKTAPVTVFCAVGYGKEDSRIVLEREVELIAT
jgi:hypothetical protein